MSRNRPDRSGVSAASWRVGGLGWRGVPSDRGEVSGVVVMSAPGPVRCALIVHDTVVAARGEVPAQVDFDGARLDDQLRLRSGRETPRHQVVKIVRFDGAVPIAGRPTLVRTRSPF